MGIEINSGLVQRTDLHMVVLMGPCVSHLDDDRKRGHLLFCALASSLAHTPPPSSDISCSARVHLTVCIRIMAISQHGEAVGEPTKFSLMDANVSILCSDAKHRDRPPRPHFDPNLPEGCVNYLEDADELAVKRWKRDIATYLVHEMNLRPNGASL